jgi:enterobactin synthetase component D
MKNSIISDLSARGWIQRFDKIDTKHFLPISHKGISISIDKIEDSLENINYNALLPAPLQRAVRKRKIEFIAGRICAENAILHLTGSLFGVGQMSSGSPAWPNGVVGSISHTDRIAYAIACQGTELRIGIDTEQFFTDQQLEATTDLCCTPTEIRHHLQADHKTLCGTVIFSAKESLYKVLNEFTGGFVDFKEVAVDKLDLLNGTISFRSLSRRLPSLSEYEGFFRYDGQYVYTSVVLKQLPQSHRCDSSDRQR